MSGGFAVYAGLQASTTTSPAFFFPFLSPSLPLPFISGPTHAPSLDLTQAIGLVVAVAPWPVGNARVAHNVPVLVVNSVVAPRDAKEELVHHLGGDDHCGDVCRLQAEVVENLWGVRERKKWA